MTRYRVCLISTASTVIEVEAEGREQAEDLAYDKVPTICAQCSGWGREAGIELSDVWEVSETWESDR